MQFFYVQSSVADITAVRTCLGKFKQIQKELYPTHYYRESRQWPQQCDIPNRNFKQTFVLGGHRFIIFWSIIRFGLCVFLCIKGTVWYMQLLLICKNTALKDATSPETLIFGSWVKNPKCHMKIFLLVILSINDINDNIFTAKAVSFSHTLLTSVIFSGGTFRCLCLDAVLRKVQSPWKHSPGSV